MPNLVVNATAFYNVRKNGGTTVRTWAKQYETGLRRDAFAQDTYYNLKGYGYPDAWRHECSNGRHGFQPYEGDVERWWITRDPLERFLSAYPDKILREQEVDWSLDQCIELLYSGKMLQIANSKHGGHYTALHMLPQSFWLGSTQSYYQHVFDLSDMYLVKEFCESIVFRMRLDDFHARNLSQSGFRKPRLSPTQVDALKHVYIQDYENGWS